MASTQKLLIPLLLVMISPSSHVVWSHPSWYNLTLHLLSYLPLWWSQSPLWSHPPCYDLILFVMILLLVIISPTMQWWVIPANQDPWPEWKKMGVVRAGEIPLSNKNTVLHLQPVSLDNNSISKQKVNTYCSKEKLTKCLFTFCFKGKLFWSQISC